MRFPFSVCLFVCFIGLSASLLAQSPNGNVNGFIADSSDAAVSGAEIVAVNDATRIQYTTKTNNEGLYVLANLPPGSYRIQVSKVGFKTVIKPDIMLNIQDALSVNFTLPVGAFHEVLTVEGSTSLVITESAAVSTVVDRKYIENMPLNGRSFQDLILLTPGVVTNSPQSSATLGVSGEFSVNGQRTESNYYLVDGVSANVGTAQGGSGLFASSGSLPASTSLGTTQALVSVDALEEFRVQTSTYSAEYGRAPGAQFSFATRSGANEWHGTAFDYLRNDIFDANNWFNNYYAESKPPLRQNDFGATWGGPVQVPYFYNGKDKTFFFFSYEGLRLIQPQATTVSDVPDATLRTSTPGPLGQVMNAFPIPNGSTLGNGLAEYIGAWSNPSSIDAFSLRFDQAVGEKLKLFFHYSNTASNSNSRQSGSVADPSVLDLSNFTTHTYTFGATSIFSPTISNEFRVNYASNRSVSNSTNDNLGGATPANLFGIQGLSDTGQPSPQITVSLFFGNLLPTIGVGTASGTQRQWNISDAVGQSAGRHQLKFGFDFRRLHPAVYQNDPVAEYIFFSSASILANSVDYGFGRSSSPAFPFYTNLSTFVQDSWKIIPRLSISMGVRWEVNPSPSAPKGNLPYTVEGNGLATLQLAPQGTPLWRTTWFNLAPRLGIAYVLRNNPSHETVVRGGAGVFFDTGQQLGSLGYFGPGFLGVNSFGTLLGVPANFPVPKAQVSPPIVNPPIPPYTTAGSVVAAYAPHLQLPFTWQWNLAVEHALGTSQAITVSYVGSNGRRLLQENTVQDASSVNPNFGAITFVGNGLTSDYNALQIQFRRRLAYGLQVLASYSWSHCLDYGSENSSLPYQRGNCDFDVRNNFTSAISYELPSGSRSRVVRALSQHWGLDNRISVRTSFPVFLQGLSVADPATSQEYYSGLNLVPSQPLYIYGSACAAVYNNGLGCPGGRAINPNAFSLPAGCMESSCPPGTAVGDAPRNLTRGFGAWQTDLAIRREFPIYERLKLQFRAEAFNLFNHPNFGTINATYCVPGPGCTFGQATASLANSLGGLSSLYQVGGSRSMQFALKLIF